MYTDIPFWLSAVFMFGGLAALAWSSDYFVDGAAADCPIEAGADVRVVAQQNLTMKVEEV